MTYYIRKLYPTILFILKDWLTSFPKFPKGILLFLFSYFWETSFPWIREAQTTGTILKNALSPHLTHNSYYRSDTPFYLNKTITSLWNLDIFTQLNFGNLDYFLRKEVTITSQHTRILQFLCFNVLSKWFLLTLVANSPRFPFATCIHICPPPT